MLIVAEAVGIGKAILELLATALARRKPARLLEVSGSSESDSSVELPLLVELLPGGHRHEHDWKWMLSQKCYILFDVWIYEQIKNWTIEYCFYTTE